MYYKKDTRSSDGKDPQPVPETIKDTSLPNGLIFPRPSNHFLARCKTKNLHNGYCLMLLIFFFANP
jgi:hypothetical protein